VVIFATLFSRKEEIDLLLPGSMEPPVSSGCSSRYFFATYPHGADRGNQYTKSATDQNDTKQNARHKEGEPPVTVAL